MNASRWALAATAILLILALSVGLRNKWKQQSAPPESSTEITGPYAPAELQNLIKKLSSPKEEDRTSAERELAKAGVFADVALKAAEPQSTGAAKEAIQRLLNRTRFLALKDLDYSTAMPAESVFYLHLPNIQDTLEKSRVTALGKLLLRPAFDKARADLWEKMKSDFGHDTVLPPLDYLKGQLAFGMFQKGFGRFESNGKLGLLFELRGADPQGGYLEWIDTLQKSGGKITEYKDIECFDAPADKGAHARTGNHIFYGSNPAALHTMIDTVLSGDGIGAVTEVKKIRESQGKSPDAAALLDIPAIINQILLSRNNDVKKPEEAAVLALIEKIGYAGLSIKCLKEGFEDRLTFLLPSGPGEIVSALTAPAGSHPPLEMLQVVPLNAAAAVMGYVDGARLEKAFIEYANSIQKLNNPAKSPPPDDAEILVPLRAIEGLLGLQKGELLANFKGEIGAWVEFKPGREITQPDVGAVVTCADIKNAAAASGVLEKIGALQPAGIYLKNVYNKRTLHSINTAKTGDAGVSLNWAVDRQRIYFASSATALKSQLDNLDRQSPGLLKREPLQKMLTDFPVEERSGTILYIDAQSVLTHAGDTFLPFILADPKTTKEAREVLTNLPPPIDLFKDFPPLVAFTLARKDRGEWIIHSPLPLIPLAALVIGEMSKQK